MVTENNSTFMTLKWKFKKILIKNISAVDTIIFKHNKLWWLFTNTSHNELSDYSSQLRAFHSINPINSNYMGFFKLGLNIKFKCFRPAPGAT